MITVLRQSIVQIVKGQLFCLLTVFSSNGLAADLTTKPIPLLHLGEQHTGKIVSISANRNDGNLLTISEDKTARVLNLNSKRLVSVLRPPQDDGMEGTLESGALSPDGKLAALGGITNVENKSISIPIFDVATGRLIRRIGVFYSAPLGMAFSTNGHYLVVASGELVLINMTTGRQSTIDDIQTRGSLFKSVHFSSDGKRLVATCLGNLFFGSCREGEVRIYENRRGHFKLIKKATPGGAREPVSARFSPDGKLIAVGYRDAPVVDVLDAMTLRIVSRLAIGDHEEIIDQLRKLKRLRNLSHVEWSADGVKLFAAGDARFTDNASVRSWFRSDWSVASDSVITTRYITGLASMPNGNIVFSTAGAGLGVINETGSEFQYIQSERPWSGHIGDTLRTSADGQTIGFNLSAEEQGEFVFKVGTRDLQRNPPEYENLLDPKDRSTKYWTTQMDDGKYLVFIGRREDSLDKDGEEMYEFGKGLGPAASHFAFAHNDSELIVLDQEHELKLIRLRKLVWHRIATTPIRGINVPAEGRFVVVAHDDGTIRWYRITDGQELLAYYPHRDSRRWIAWTPEGFYASSGPDAEGLMGYHVNRGTAHEGQFISAQQLSQHFYQPGLISRRLSPEGDSLMAEAVQKLGDVRQLLAGADGLTPEVEVISEKKVSSEEEITITVRLKDQGGGIGGVTYYVDGVPQTGRQAGVVADTTDSRIFRLPQGERRIEVAARNRAGVEGPRAAITVTITGAASEAALHILSVGIEKYQAHGLELKNGVADAQAVADEIASRAKPIFKRGVSVPKVLKNDEASLAGIESAFAELRRRMKPDDTLVIFLAGHGEAPIGKGYTFLPWDFDRHAAGPTREGLNEKRLKDMLAQAPRKTLVLLDTCDAGGLVEMIDASYDRLSGITNQVVIGASRRGEFAKEGYKGHGVFTAALLRTINKSADGEEDRRLRIPELRVEVAKEVNKIVREMKSTYRQTVSGFLGSANFPIVMR